MPADTTGTTRSTSAGPGPLVVLGLDEDDRPASPGLAPAERPAPPEAGRMPLAPLAGLVTSGTFAVWTSLTCFVC